jgi:hypothetical protein
MTSADFLQVSQLRSLGCPRPLVQTGNLRFKALGQKNYLCVPGNPRFNALAVPDFRISFGFRDFEFRFLPRVSPRSNQASFL